MRRKFKKRLLSVLLVISMVAAYALPAHAASGSTGITFEKTDSSAVSASAIQKDPVEETESAPYQDTDIVRVSIILTRKSTLEAGYSTQNIAENASAMAYRSSLEAFQDKVETRIENALGAELDVVWNLTLAADIISANVAYGDIETILAVSGVEDVVIETEYEAAETTTDSDSPDTSVSSGMIGASTAWATGYTGAGTRIAVIDTGIDTDHQSFSAEGFEYSLSLLAEEAGMSYEDYVASLDLLDADEIASVLDQLNISAFGVTAEELYVSTKIGFGFNYVDVDYDITHDNDSQSEHGSHVEGIAAANTYIANEDGTFSDALATVGVQGVAPDAQIITMKVFGKSGGAYDSDYMAAIEDAIILGADSINLSLGSSSPGMTYSATEAYQAIMDQLAESDTVVTISAGNAGYWSESSTNFIGYYSGTGYLYADDVSMDTVGSPGSFTNALTVASVDNDGAFGNYFQVEDTAYTYTESSYSNLPLASLDTTGTGTEYTYIYVDGIGEATDYEGIDLTGKIVFCSRGTTSFYVKAEVAVELGAAATIIYNNTTGSINMDLSDYSYTAPAVSILQSQAAAIKAVSTEQTTESGLTYYTGTITIYGTAAAISNNSEYYTMSSFSSWGIPGSLTLKPEITAPGGSIYSVNGADESGTGYELMSGTSMAAPQVAGMSALLAQYIQESGLTDLTGQTSRVLAQSLLMSTSVPLYDGETGSYYSVLQQGAGLADVSAAISATSYIMMGEDATESYADGKIKAELGDDPNRDGVYSFSFTINNLTDTEEVYQLSADLFTQDLFLWYTDEYYNTGLYMDTATTGLAYGTTWTVDGKTLTTSADLSGMDFNGDGVVNTADGQALLDLATGARESIYHTELADLNEDGAINSYDAYLFFNLISTGTATVPAYGSVEVTVTLTLTDEQKAYLDTYYTGGAYVEGYVYATAASSDEGVEGTCHSIPVLAFYGSWTDASMYDSISWTDYYGGDTSWDYMGTYYSNYVSITYGDGSGTYAFGGNPLFYETYDESRNAISVANGDSFGKAVYTLIRNAAAGKLTITNNTTGEIEYESSLSQAYSAYYYTNAGSWYNTSSSVGLNFVPAGDEGDTYTIALTVAPEYYVTDGTVDWDALGDGATLSISFTIDNTAPEVTDITGSIISSDGADTLTICAEDNQYIAGAMLYDSTGTQLLWYEAGSQTASGEAQEFTLDCSEMESGVYLLQIYDYAMNVSTYRVFVDLEITDTVEGITVSPESARIMKGSMTTLTATVLPVNISDDSVTWTSDDETVATVSANGVVTGISDGTCTITATSVLDPSISASCSVEVFSINKTLNATIWDENGEVWWASFNVDDPAGYTHLTESGAESPVWSVAVQDGTLYAQDYYGSFYSVDPDTFELTTIGAASFDYTDMAETYNLDGYILAAYGKYILLVDPSTGEYIGAFNLASYLSGNLTGITYMGSADYTSSYGVYADFYYLVDSTGSVYYTGLLKYGTGYSGFGIYSLCDTGASASAYYYNSAYYDFDTGYLFYSAYSGSVSTLYAIDVDNTGDCYTLGDFGDGVWPASGLLDLSSYEFTETANTDALDLVVAESMQAISDEEIQALRESKAAGSLNAAASIGETAQPNASGDASIMQIVTVDITAKDAEGMEIDSTNGVIEVTYDADALKLWNVTINADYTSKVEKDGSVTIGYVSLDGIPAGETVATLQFVVLKPCEDADFTIYYKEVNDQTPDTGYTELLTVEVAHEAEAVPAKDATCEENGNIAYWYCPLCGKYFSDAECTVEITLEDTIIPATGHSWELDYVYWDDAYETCYFILKCANGCGDQRSCYATVTTETVEATCEEDGYITYTATFTDTYDGDKVYTDSVTVTIPATGHSYELEYTYWTDDHATCYFVINCVNCGDDQRMGISDSVTGKVTVEPTCYDEGEIVYTATWTDTWDSNKVYTATITVVLSATDHSWELDYVYWDDAHETCFFILKCANGCGEQRSCAATVTTETVDATCEEDGYITYTATFTDIWDNDKVYTDTVTVAIPATGHSWELDYVYWDDAHETCYFILKCANGCGEQRSCAATVTTETVDATC
ncbi:MAG: S8 family serine peptidase, partial [Firmicutes bacterium]|nr:S8 family serine peptidase [Bacillota bacterium]